MYRPAKSSTKSYLTHDNSQRPFSVGVSKTRFVVKKKSGYDKESNPYDMNVVHTTTYVNAWKGDPAGTSWLFQVDDTHYIFVGATVVSFKSSDQVVAFAGKVVGNDVIEPYALTETDCALVFCVGKNDVGEEVATFNTYIGTYIVKFRFDDYGNESPIAAYNAMTRSKREKLKRVKTKTLHPRLYPGLDYGDQRLVLWTEPASVTPIDRMPSKTTGTKRAGERR